ncbi:hypothetical protein C5L25_000133 [Secundilactobacillus silagei JCM 19001]|uniref:Competence protein ComFA n=1 Tax=Secundilactobacillus silagei JCM 19001 TaxID=1302250 RepID=A0A1Z5IGN6_9LACO|nr:hypothetical protein C5L25_000133 [Secundilactobacillus silagei JCM 19001]GAX00925.1 competence protein ComFA [Secundilactobacillus silagei JCM 19001]
MQATQLFGRQLLADTMPNVAEWQPKLLRRPAMTLTAQWAICQRCGQRTVKQTVQLPRNNYYCPHCFQLGRVTSDQWLWSLPEPNQFAKLVKLDRPADACSGCLQSRNQCNFCCWSDPFTVGSDRRRQNRNAV